MRCGRCSGFILEDGENTHCLLCGHYPLNVPYPEPVRDPYSRKKCSNCRENAKADRNYCQVCLDWMKDYRKRKATA